MHRGSKWRSGKTGSFSGIEVGGFNLYFVLSVFWRRICFQAYLAESYLQSQRNQTWIHHRHAGARRLQAEAQVRGPPNLLGSDSGLRDVGLDALTPGPLAGTGAVHTAAMRNAVFPGPIRSEEH